MKSPEHNLQSALFVWAKLNESKYPALRWLHAIPSGGKRNIRVAMKLKQEGVKRGIVDVCLPYPSKGWHGLYAEAKIKPNKCTPEQVEFIDFLRENNYYVFVFYDIEYAIEMIERYLK